MVIMMKMIVMMIMINKNNGDIGFETWSIAEKHIRIETADTLLRKILCH
jgi:hypothetical protein